jgi:hypothetical protein
MVISGHGSQINYDSCTYNSSTGNQDCTHIINTSPTFNWMSTDGYSLTVDTDLVGSYASSYSYSIYNQWTKYNNMGLYTEDAWNIIIDPADPSDPCQCLLTALTTDSAITGTTIEYGESSGLQTYPMDTIISQTPSCGFTTFTYSIRETTLGSMTTKGITVNNGVSPPNLEINSNELAS